jgi:hypothetical protein
VEKHPNVTYLILGATHPAVLRSEGEAYRLSLQRRARELGVEQHVLFHPRFVELTELLEYLGAADIFVTPYLAMDQITSGVLAYAMGAGKAVVSTPYWHAQELLAEERGRLVPPGDAEALAGAITGLLADDVATAAMRKRAYLHCRASIWPSVARQYLDLFDEIRHRAPTAVPVAASLRRTLAASSLPTPKLDHVERLGDDTGLAHHARRTVPDFSHGYFTEDAAMALVVSAKFHDLFRLEPAARIAERSLALLLNLIGDPVHPIPQRFTYGRLPEGQLDHGGLGKVIWALGYAVSHGPTMTRSLANDLFNQLIPDQTPASHRGAAHATLGAADYLRRFPGASAVRRYLEGRLSDLAAFLEQPDWHGRWKGPDWPVAVQALAVAASVLKDKTLTAHAGSLSAQMCRACRQGTEFLILGEDGDQEEHPITAATFIEALGAVMHLGFNDGTVDAVRSAADWFLGANQPEHSLYDFATGGCHDVLTARGLNENQGTEATLYCLLAFLTLHELALWNHTSVSGP